MGLDFLTDRTKQYKETKEEDFHKELIGCLRAVVDKLDDISIHLDDIKQTLDEWHRDNHYGHD